MFVPPPNLGIPRACPNHRRVAVSYCKALLYKPFDSELSFDQRRTDVMSLVTCSSALETQLLSLTHARLHRHTGPRHRSAPTAHPPHDLCRTTSPTPRPSTNPQEQSSHSILRRPPPEDNAHVIDVSEHTYGELERFAKYASAAYQVSWSPPAGQYARAIRKLRARLTFVGLFAHYLGMFAVVLQSTMGSCRVPFGGARLLLHIGSVSSLWIWSLVSSVFLFCLLFSVCCTV